MHQDKTVTGVLIEESACFTIIEVCERYQISQALLVEMIEQGLFKDETYEEQKLNLNQKSLKRMETAFRLHRDLNINLPGVALALELLEQLDRLHAELGILRKHF